MLNVKNENKTIILFKNNRIQNLGVGYGHQCDTFGLFRPLRPQLPLLPLRLLHPPTSHAIYGPFVPNAPSPLPSAAPPSSPHPREMENISRGPIFWDFVTIRT